MSSFSNYTDNSNDNISVTPPLHLPGLISFRTKNIILDVISCGIQPIPSLLGMVGNLLSLVVLAYQGIKQTTNILLIGLAVADLLYAGTCVTSTVECLARHMNDSLLALEIQALTVVYVEKLASVFGLVSRWYTCFVAVERFIAVQFPLKASSLLQRNRMIIASVFLWVFAFVSRFHHFLLFEVTERYNSKLNRTEKIAQPSDFLVHNFRPLTIGGVLTVISSRYLPVLVVFVCTCAILRCLRASLLQRNQMRCTVSSAEAQQLQITQILVGISIVFLITSIPGIASNIARLLFVQEGFLDVGRYQNSHAVVKSVELLFNLFNSSVNVVFYVLYSKPFVLTCRQLFGFLSKTPNPQLRDVKDFMTNTTQSEHLSRYTQ